MLRRQRLTIVVRAIDSPPSAFGHKGACCPNGTAGIAYLSRDPAVRKPVDFAGATADFYFVPMSDPAQLTIPAHLKPADGPSAAVHRRSGPNSCRR